MADGVESEALHPQVVQRDPRTLRLLDVNARFMPKVDYDRLVANMRRDGACTSAPLVWHDPDTGDEIVLSGNHRVQAAVDANLPEITCLLLDQPLSAQRRVAIQLSHNAITGTDDHGLLAELYSSIGDVDLRAYCGLDDKTLDLLGVVQPEAFGEEPLAYATVALLFLPAEAERLMAVFEEATRTVDADQLLAARYTEHRRFLAALDTVRDSYRVGSAAIAIGLVLDVFEAHLGDNRTGWYDPDTGEPIVPRTNRVPIETILETRTIPADAAAVIARAIDHAQARGDVTPAARWRALELWAADYLAGP
jgi:hypothetical protein